VKIWRTKDKGPVVPNEVTVEETVGVPVVSPDTQFPHCDSLILHSPGTCVYCDRHPDWQQYRMGAGIAFSDYDEATVEELRLIPCPSTARRPAEVRDQWYGNVPRGYFI
jgi:hypothetical protein